MLPGGNASGPKINMLPLDAEPPPTVQAAYWLLHK
jgi:hypothetical protein